jgi:hypothetical protein
VSYLARGQICHFLVMPAGPQRTRRDPGDKAGTAGQGANQRTRREPADEAGTRRQGGTAGRPCDHLYTIRAYLDLHNMPALLKSHFRIYQELDPPVVTNERPNLSNTRRSGCPTCAKPCMGHRQACFHGSRHQGPTTMPPTPVPKTKKTIHLCSFGTSL